MCNDFAITSGTKLMVLQLLSQSFVVVDLPINLKDHPNNITILKIFDVISKAMLMRASENEYTESALLP